MKAHVSARSSLFATLLLALVLMLGLSGLAAAEGDTDAYVNLIAGRSFTVPAGALEPHESFPETVPSKLTDGVRLPEGRTHNSGREYLLAFVKPGARGVEASIIYDLDDVRTIKQVRISAYSWRTSAYTYYYPDLIQVFVSSDGVRWSQVVNYPNPIPRAQQENPGENQVRWFDLDIEPEAQARYVRIDLTSYEGTSYIILDEIEILGR